VCRSTTIKENVGLKSIRCRENDRAKRLGKGLILRDYLYGIILYYYFLKTKVGNNLCYPKCWITEKGGESVIEQLNPF
jgi:hypothetical protein